MILRRETMKARFIVITRCITVAAWKHVTQERADRARYYEFVPGQRVRVRGKNGDCFRFDGGWAEVPRGAWAPAGRA
jgi:hypothetical protein